LAAADGRLVRRRWLDARCGVDHWTSDRVHFRGNFTDMPNDLIDVWRRIDGWLSSNAKPLAADLSGPATADAIAKAEADVGQPFPVELRQSLAVHDGQRGAGFEVFGVWGLLSLRQIVDEWSELQSLAAEGAIATNDDPAIKTLGAVRPRWWDPAWIPVAKNASGDWLCLDMNPPASGRSGQVVAYWHDVPKREVVAPDFAAWLAQIAGQLEGGDFAVAGARDRLQRIRR
jgi:cell wall assembly regulator SMI1